MNNQYPGWELKYFDKAKNFRDYQFSLIRNFIKKNVAEVGPGNGIHIKSYLKLSKTINLFEPTKKNFLYLKKNFKKNNNIKLHNRIFKLEKNKYDTILYLDVLEHIKNSKAEIIKAFKSLKKNGHLIINVPAFQHLYSDFDNDVGHFKRYQKKDFKNLIEILKQQVTLKFYYDSFGYILSLLSKIFLKKYKKNFSKKIKIWNRLIFISKIIDILTFNIFGKSLLVIIKK